MNRKLIITILILLIVIGSAITYVLLKKDTSTESQGVTSETIKKEDSLASQVTPEAASKGLYVAYSEEAFSASRGIRFLFFHAPWCPQCRSLDESIKASELPDDLTIFKVDYDSNQALRAKYGVTLQTTVVKVDENGSKINSYVAYDEPTFESVMRALLP